MTGMRGKTILAVLVLFGILQASAFADSLQEQYGLDALAGKIGSGEVDSRKLRIVYLVLANTKESHIHRQRGAEDNQVFLHRDGHKEAVFDRDGNAVKDGMNDASYNLAHPIEEPLKHFLMDIHPWLIWGASPRDQTSQEERTRAYLADLEGGLRAALASKAKLDDIDTEWDSGQIEVLAFFLSAIEKGGAEELFDLFEKDAGEATDRQFLRIMKKLETGFNKLL